MKLDRRTAIITGAGSGIGEASARLFAKEGARLVLVDVDEEGLAKLTKDLEDRSTIVLDTIGDVSVPSVCKSVIERTVAQFGRLDIVFNNAEVVPDGTLVDCPEEEWHRTLDANLKSMYLLCRGAIPMMQRQGSGSIINMSSVAGAAGVPNQGVYSVSKAAVFGLTKSLAIDFVKDGIRVNCICPGTIDAPALHRRIATSTDPESARREFVARQPMGRLGTCQEVAAMALFLASDDSRFMTGQAIFMDGGMKL